MKSFALLSASLFLSALPQSLAAPTVSNEIGARWFRPGQDTAPAVETVSTAAVDDDPANDYVVVLADDDKRPWAEVFADMGCNSSDVQTFSATGMRGFTMNMKQSHGYSMLSLPNVAIVEKDVVYRAAVIPRDPSAKPRKMSRSQVKESLRMSKRSELAKRQQGIFIEQSTAPWNLQRISSQSTVAKEGRQTTDLTYKYRFDQVAGAGVDVYMLDTGIEVGNVDFGGRAQMIFSINGNNIDGEGHGTHTAGTVGSMTFGVAKNVNLLGVKVLGDDGSGSIAGIVQGINVAVQRHNQRLNQPGFMGSIISMSLGGDGLPAIMNLALKNATGSGIHVSVAAGNENQDACNTSPAGFSTSLPIISVGATDINDARASFSNVGPCVDIHAPGVQITSTFNNGANSIAVLDGTSMACPAVTGMIADLLTQNPQFKTDPAGMKKLLLSKALDGVIKAGANVPAGGQVLLNSGFPGNPAKA